jgi:alpha-L-fucosidase 2
MKKIGWFLVAFIFLISCTESKIEQNQLNNYNVIWETPSKDVSGQMPLGNGDIAAGVYAIENDALYLLLSKNDAFTYNGDLFKTGRVRVEITPNPFISGKSFKQTMNLETGSVDIIADGVNLKIWADANQNVYHIEIDADKKIEVTTSPEFWKRIDNCRSNLTSEPIETPTQDVHLKKDGNILWYYAVGDRSVYPKELNFYDVPQMESVYPDPYRFNTFGNLLESPDLKLEGGELKGSGNKFDIRIHSLTKQTAKPKDWIKSIEIQAENVVDTKKDWVEHLSWWAEFWSRSWITVSDNSLPIEKQNQINNKGYIAKRKSIDDGALVAQSYNVFRYLMACQSRGKIQAKFNGGLFTQNLRSEKKPRLVATQREDSLWISHEDVRPWGRRFTYQNQRLLYWPLLMSGDGDLMKPFFDYYWNLLPVRRAITKAWFDHEGTYYRENVEPTGGERDCGWRKDDSEAKPLKTPPGQNDGNGYYHSYYFTSGLETVAMMIEHAKYSGDTKFKEEVLVPFAREILLFFDKHYKRDENGKLRIDPGMVLETWWIAVNPAPDVAGLLHDLDELLAMNAGTTEDIQNWKRFRSEIPDVHLHKIENKTAIAPALSWDKKRNAENGLLYPVFPFRRFGLGMGTKDIVEWTMRNRTNKNSFDYKCWTQDQIHWAYAGNAKEAQEGLVHRFQHASPQCRFPLYGSKGPDSCPDFDHFGSGSTALQRMLVQEADGKILLLPAWPANWDTDFKLHLSYKTTISGKVKNGELLEWSIEPETRMKDVVVYAPQ